MARFARLLLLGISGAAALSITATPARADSAAARSSAAPSCQALLGGHTATGIQIPSNAPALLVVDPQYQYYLPATITAELVEGDKKTPLAAPTRDANGLNALVLPGESGSALKLAVTATCNGSSMPPQEVPVQRTNPVPFPTAVGALKVVTSGPPSGVTLFTLEPGSNVREFLPVMQFSLSVNGEKAIAQSGALSNADIQFSVKTGVVCVENGALHREKRNVRISVGAAIAGVAQALADVAMDLEVDCGAIKWTRAEDFTNDGDGKTPTTAPGGSSSSDGGCSAAPGAPASGAAGAFVLALGSLVVLRRRRRA